MISGRCQAIQFWQSQVTQLQMHFLFALATSLCLDTVHALSVYHAGTSASISPFYNIEDKSVTPSDCSNVWKFEMEGRRLCTFYHVSNINVSLCTCRQRVGGVMLTCKCCGLQLLNKCDLKLVRWDPSYLGEH